MKIIRPESGVAAAGARTVEGAFTLMELLTSMGVLVLLVVMVSQLTSGTVLTTVGAGKRIDADSQARLIFDRMATDFAGIVKRPDANYYFHHQTGNDALYFFSDATGYFASGDAAGSGVSVRNTATLTGYRISDQISNDARFELERLGRGLHWHDNAPGASPNGPLTEMVYLPLTITGATTGAYNTVLSDPYNNSSNLRPSASASDPNVPQWDVIGNQVVRMEFCYLLKDGTLAAVPVVQTAAATNNLAAAGPPAATNDLGQGYVSGSRWYDAQAEIGYVCASAAAGAAIWNPVGLQDIRAVVVGILILDNRSRLLVNAQTMTTLIAALPDFSATAINPATNKPTLMADAWKAALYASPSASPAPSPSSNPLPAAVAGNARIYQRYFFLN